MNYHVIKGLIWNLVNFGQTFFLSDWKMSENLQVQVHKYLKLKLFFLFINLKKKMNMNVLHKWIDRYLLGKKKTSLQTYRFWLQIQQFCPQYLFS